MSPAERALRSRLGGLQTAANGTVNTVPARAAFDRRFLDQVDPDRILSEPERERRATAARKAHFARLALRSARVRAGTKKAAAEIQTPATAKETDGGSRRRSPAA